MAGQDAACFGSMARKVEGGVVILGIIGPPARLHVVDTPIRHHPGAEGGMGGDAGVKMGDADPPPIHRLTQKLQGLLRVDRGVRPRLIGVLHALNLPIATNIYENNPQYNAILRTSLLICCHVQLNCSSGV